MKREVILPGRRTAECGILSPGIRVGDLLWTAGALAETPTRA